MTKGFVSSLVFFLLLASACTQLPQEDPSGPEIKLVLQITVDGLRGDLLNRYESGFGPDGFRYLMQNGVVYGDAHYQHANTETIVGHATLSTGTFPSVHGMVGNVWLDKTAGELAYNIEDPESPLLPSREEVSVGEQVDPAQLTARTQGRSPVALLAPTFADSLAAFYAGGSKIFGVSGKDRSAVAMAGKVGKAFWFSTDTGDFITSRYYYEAYPDWVTEWNAQRKAETYEGKSWTLFNKQSDYRLGDHDDRPYEVDLRGFGRIFPHPYGERDGLFATKLMVSPAGDRLTLDFSKQLISNEGLGQDTVPDYLSISFSSVDAVNHFFGASSLENEDVVVQLDRTIAELLAFVDDEVGLEHTLLILAADHGMADMPEYMTELGYDAGRLVPDQIIEAGNSAGESLGIDRVVKYFFRPYIYLDDDSIEAAGVDRELVEKSVADAVTQIPGVSRAVMSQELKETEIDPLLVQIRNNYHPARSGDIYVVQEPYWFLFDVGPVAVMHGSPWRYDTHVPVIFAGPGITPQTVHRRVHPVDIVPTMSLYLGMTPPAASQGLPLEEVLSGNNTPSEK